MGDISRGSVDVFVCGRRGGRCTFWDARWLGGAELPAAVVAPRPLNPLVVLVAVEPGDPQAGLALLPVEPRGVFLVVEPRVCFLVFAGPRSGLLVLPPVDPRAVLVVVVLEPLGGLVADPRRCTGVCFLSFTVKYFAGIFFCAPVPLLGDAFGVAGRRESIGVADAFWLTRLAFPLLLSALYWEIIFCLFVPPLLVYFGCGGDLRWCVRGGCCGISIFRDSNGYLRVF